jgi:heat shock protein HslJ
MYNYKLFLFIFSIFISCNFFPTKDDRGPKDIENLPFKGTVWELSSFNYFNQPPIKVECDEFTILFSDTGTVKSKVDCNECFGEYSLFNDNKISINFGFCTKIYCGEDSRDTNFHNAIDSTTKYSIKDAELELYFGENNLSFIGR